MRFPAEKITLKDGREAVLRLPEVADAAEMVDCLKQLCSETPFLLRSAEEFSMTVEEEAALFEKLAASSEKLYIICTVGGEIAGSCSLSCSLRQKIQHRASIGISVLKRFWGLGLGSAMFAAMEKTARGQGITQLELGHMGSNVRAHQLYLRMGFTEYGRCPNAFRQPSGVFEDEVLMYKSLTD
ncbi:MAG: GNAT family N-acetyltransferase [Oscillospiraceae bacterium]|nr:GNAT family N-acetyltransferase [Oscillospiraceae bacterium]